MMCGELCKNMHRNLAKKLVDTAVLQLGVICCIYFVDSTGENIAVNMVVLISVS